MQGKESDEVMAAVRAFAAPDASIAQGIAYDDKIDKKGDDIRVTVVATGLGKAKKAMQLVQQPMLRTGTHGGLGLGSQPMMASGGGLSASAGVTMGAASAGHAAVDGMKQPAV